MNQNLILYRRKNIKINFKHLRTINYIEQIRNIRKKILYTHLPTNLCFYKEDFSIATYHFGIFIDNELVSVLTLIKNFYIYNTKLSSYQLRGMATKTEFQRRYIGKSLLQKSLQYINLRTNTSLVWCNARKNVFNFYSKNKFKQQGSLFYIKNIGLHYTMYFDCRLLKKQS